MLNNINKISFIKYNNIEEKEIICEKMKSLNFINTNIKREISNDNFCIIYPSEKLYQFLSMNPDPSYQEILYSDVIKPNSLSLLESKLKNLFLDPSICIRLDSIQDRCKMTKLMIELDFKWLSGISFINQSIESVSDNKYFIPFANNTGSRLLAYVTDKKIIPFKNILKEIGLEELNNKNNNNNN